MSQPAPSSSSRWSRRQLVPAVAAWAAASRFAPSARAADDGKAKIWTSGRSDPIRPTSKDKADGTKKDPKYLGCLNDCVPLCTSSYAAETGKPKERSDCFEECQDQCCSTCASPRERSHGPPHSAQPQLSYSHSSAARTQLSLISASPPCSGVHPRPTQVPAVHVRHPKVTLRRPAGHWASRSSASDTNGAHKWTCVAPVPLVAEAGLLCQHCSQCFLPINVGRVRSGASPAPPPLPDRLSMSAAAPPPKNNPAEFLKQVLGRPVVVKLNSGVDYRGGVPPCPDPLGIR